MGVGVAARRLGLDEWAVENSRAVKRIRGANGMTTEVDDIWDAIEDPDLIPPHDVMWASPPCQPFTMAGAGAGRRALDEVLQLIERRGFLQPEQMRAFGEQHDERTALVLTPLTLIHDHMPRAIVLEQVPPVLPVWEAFVEPLTMMGYSVVTGILHAEQYGVPQARKRAILVARLDSRAEMPQPTHSRYHRQAPARLDEGVLPWVTMAAALGRTFEGEQAWANERPATTVVGTFAPERLAAPGYRTVGDHSRQNAPGTITMTRQEAAILQGFPADFLWPEEVAKSPTFQAIGNAVPPPLAAALLREVTSAAA